MTNPESENNILHNLLQLLRRLLTFKKQHPRSLSTLRERFWHESQKQAGNWAHSGWRCLISSSRQEFSAASWGCSIHSSYAKTDFCRTPTGKDLSALTVEFGNRHSMDVSPSMHMRKAFYRELAKRDPEQRAFLQGWLNRVEAVVAEVSMGDTKNGGVAVH
jgi:hypothetical protein